MSDEDRVEGGNPFVIPDFFKGSQWLDGGLPHGNDLFDLDPQGGLKSSLFQFKPIENKDFFTLPQTKDDEHIPETLSALLNGNHAESVEAREPTHEAKDEDVHIDDRASEDVWLSLSEPQPEDAEYKTWDAFEKGVSAPTSGMPMLITEAGPGAFDALVNLEGDPLKLKSCEAPSVGPRACCSALLSLALGRESLLFAWQEDLAYFKPTLPNLRIPGCTTSVLHGVIRRCLACGNAFRGLQAFTRRIYAKNATPCRVALASAIEKVLLVIQSSIAIQERRLRSILHLQHHINRLSRIVLYFHRLIALIKPKLSDEGVLSVVFEQVQAMEYGEPQVKEITRQVLQRVSRPWIDFLEEWLGTKPELGVPLSKHEIGRRKGFVKVDTETYVDDHGDEIEDVDFRLDLDRIPSFMSPEIMQSVYEAGRNIRFIRTSHPDHWLARSEQASQKAFAIEWQFDWDSVHRLERNVSSYEASLLTEAARSRSGDQPLARSKRDRAESAVYKLQMFSTDQGELQERLAESIDHLSRPWQDPSAGDRLAKAVHVAIRSGTAAETNFAGVEFTPHWSLLPALSFGSIISAQSRVVGRESLKLLFKEHHLRDHLRLQRDFHLCRNGMFCSRLAHALFDPELESAERQAGVARQGGIMGLRLGGRDTWPPASSELRLALMGVLLESYHGEQSLNSPGQPKQLPGDLSFGVRDLSSEEIDKCMDPNGLEALDFLRLAYKAPSALNVIITPTALAQYDRIFKLLLRVLRMADTVNRLFRDVTGRSLEDGDEPEEAAIRFCYEARHFISSLTSYMFDTGIEMPWQRLEGRLDEVETQLADESPQGPALGPDRVKEHHSAILDQIMSALLLRKRQQPVMKLLEDIFRTILRFAKYERPRGTQQDHPEGENATALYKMFRRSVQVFITVGKAMVEKQSGGRPRDRAEGDQGKSDGTPDENPLVQLLLKLDMFDYYVKK